MTHTCEDHGHYCLICEEEEAKKTRLEELDKLVASWNFDACPAEAAKQAIQAGYELEEVQEALERAGFPEEQNYDLELAWDVVEELL